MEEEEFLGGMKILFLYGVWGIVVILMAEFLCFGEVGGGGRRFDGTKMWLGWLVR